MRTPFRMVAFGPIQTSSSMTTGRRAICRPRPALPSGEQAIGVGDALGRGDRVEVGVGDRGVPADDDVAADAQLQLAEQHGVREVAVVADLDAPLLADGEVDPVHRAVGADHQRRVEPAAEPLEGVVAGQHAVRADADVRRQRPVRPASRARQSERRRVIARLTSAAVTGGTPILESCRRA